MKPRCRLCRYERAQSTSGHRINNWYLQDSTGREHLAVVGSERDTRDGHYSYRAQPAFEELQPLENVSNITVRPLPAMSFLTLQTRPAL